MKFCSQKFFGARGLTPRVAKRVAMLATVLVGIAAACSNDSSEHIARTGSAVSSATSTSAANAPSSSASPTVAGYVGIHYDPLPRGTKLEDGQAIPRKGGVLFDLSRVMTPRGDYLWLDSLLPDDGQNRRRSRIVRAALRLPPLAADERLLIGSCDVNGKLDYTVVAIAQQESGETRYKSVLQAWRADAATGSFIILPVTGITCEEPGD